MISAKQKNLLWTRKYRDQEKVAIKNKMIAITNDELPVSAIDFDEIKYLFIEFFKKDSTNEDFYKKEIENLELNNNKLYEKNTELNNRINGILKAIKKFFRKLLQLGSEIIKEATTSEIKQYYDDKNFKAKDVVNISVDTTKEDELFRYVNYERYYGKPSYNELDDEYVHKKDNDLEIGI